MSAVTFVVFWIVAIGALLTAVFDIPFPVGCVTVVTLALAARQALNG